MREPDETAGIVGFGLPHAIVDEPAGCEICLVEARAAAQHAGIDTGGIHHADMRPEIGKERVEQVKRIAVTVEFDRGFARIALEQFGWRVMLLEVDEHEGV